MATMKAVRIHSFGEPEVLRIVRDTSRISPKNMGCVPIFPPYFPHMGCVPIFPR